MSGAAGRDAARSSERRGLADHVYGLLVRAYPTALRREFGEDMVAMFRDQRRATGKNPLRRAELWVRAVVDLAIHAVRERRDERRDARQPGVPAHPRAGYRRRDAWGGFLSDVGYSLRVTARTPASSTIMIATLALGMGAAAAVFAVVDAVLLHPLPYEEPGRLVSLGEVRPDGVDMRLSQANFIDWRSRNRVFTDIAPIRAFPTAYVTLTGAAEALRVPAHRVSGAFFDVLGVDAAIGRTLGADDDRPGATPVVVLGDAIWRRVFGADRSVIGRTVRIDEEPHAIVGVMPPDFTFLLPPWVGEPDLWRQGALPPEDDTSRLWRTLDAIARLRPGVTVEEAQADLDVITTALAEEYPPSNSMSGKPFGARVVPLHERLVVSETRVTLVVLSGAVALLLLISWINVANLMFAQTMARSREIAVRTALGAGRWRVARQFLTHALVLSAVGGLLALGLSRLLIPALLAAAPGGEVGVGGVGADVAFIPLLSRAHVSTWVIVMTVVTVIVTAGVCGVAPALRAASRPPGEGLKVARPMSQRRGSTGSLLVSVEVSLALVLLIGVGLLVETLVHIARIPAGFDAEGVDVVRIQMAVDRYTAPADDAATDARSLTPAYHALVRDVVREVSALPGVGAAGATNILPAQNFNSMASFHLEGLEREAAHLLQGVPVHGMTTPILVTPGYFRAIGTHILAGRAFTNADDASSSETVIIDQATIDGFDLPDPLRGTLQLSGSGGWRRADVVGIAEARLNSFSNEVMSGEIGRLPIAYLPYRDSGALYGPNALPQYLTVNFVARRDPGGRSVVDAMRAIVQRADPDTPITYAGTLDDYIAAHLGDRRFPMLLIGILAVVSSLLALSGVYGILSFAVGRRVHEIGVRVALGAQADEVVRMIVKEGAELAILGALVGVAVAMGTTRLLSKWLFAVSPTDPMVLIGLAIAMVVVASLAAWVPAHRAATIDPVEALAVE